MTSSKKVVIISKDRIIRGIPNDLVRGGVCYYLCDDYSVYSTIKTKYAGDLDIQLLGRQFHEVIESISAKFLAFSHRINKRNASYAFWGTHLASRSSGTIPLLKHIVYFCCAKKLVEHIDSRIVIICDSLSLVKIIQEYVQDRGIKCEVHLSALERLKPYWNRARLVAKATYFFFSFILLLIYSKVLKNRRITKDSIRKRYVLWSWVTAGSVNESGHYEDRNFGVLPRFLERQGKDVWTIPFFFNLDRNIFAQMKLMSKSGYQFIFPEQYLSLRDITRSLRDGINSLFLKLDGCDFDGHDISCLVREMHWSRSLQGGLLFYYSFKYLLREFAARKINIDYFLYPIENNPPEKPFILGARQYYSGSKIIGYQHTVWLKEQLGVFLLPEELVDHPLPDQIVCSGRRYQNILKTTGFRPGMLTLGPNLRYTAVNENIKVKQWDESSDVRKILIILNYEINHSMEVLEKTGAALDQFDNIAIYIKAHPQTPKERIQDFLRDIAFPAYEWATGSVQTWVLKSDVVVMTGSSVSNLETMATGVPLVRISIENGFDFDCLWDDYPFAPFASSIPEIRCYLKKAMRLSTEERERLIMFGRKIVRDYFEPVTPEKLSVFL